MTNPQIGFRADLSDFKVLLDAFLPETDRGARNWMTSSASFPQ
jgi:hypothetical protein